MRVSRRLCAATSARVKSGSGWPCASTALPGAGGAAWAAPPAGGAACASAAPPASAPAASAAAAKGREANGDDAPSSPAARCAADRAGAALAAPPEPARRDDACAAERRRSGAASGGGSDRRLTSAARRAAAHAPRRIAPAQPRATLQGAARRGVRRYNSRAVGTSARSEQRIRCFASKVLPQRYICRECVPDTARRQLTPAASPARRPAASPRC